MNERGGTTYTYLNGEVEPISFDWDDFEEITEEWEPPQTVLDLMRDQ